MEEKLTYLFTIKSGGDVEYIKNTILDILFSHEEVDILKFIKEFVGYILDDLHIDNVELFIDNTLQTENLDKIQFTKDTVAYHSTINGKQRICISSSLFNNRKDILNSCLTLAHELKHAQVAEHNKKFKRYVGKNSSTYIPGGNRKNLINAGLSDETILLSIYINDKNEKLANQYSYNFILNLCENILKDLENTNNFNKFFFVAYKNKIEALYTTYNNTVNTNEFLYNKITVYQIRQIFNLKLEELLANKKNVMKKNSRENQVKLIDSFLPVIRSFCQIYDAQIFNKIKKQLEVLSYENPIFFYLYTECLNSPYYVIKSKDLDFYDSMCEKYNTTFNFEDIKMDRKNLVNYYLNKHYAEKFEFSNYLINNYNTNSITNSYQLRILYNTYDEILNEHKK